MTLEGMRIGNYRLQRLIGSGGMGEVYLAEDTRISRKVAVKIVKNETDPYPDEEATKDAVRLFEREMKAITTLDHPNILPLFDFGEETSNKTALTYMVMPFRTEGSLVDWLQQQGNANTLPPQLITHIVHQAADALQHAHNRHLMHLDIKPSNFLIRQREGTARFPDLLLADFGIAKFSTATATVSQSIRGTPAYMAPEQWAGKPTAATDQYALAIMAYQMLTGKVPFRGNMQQVMYQHLQEQPQSPSAIDPRIPATIDMVVLRALAKKPEERFPSVQHFATAFEQACYTAMPAIQPQLPPKQVQTTAPSQPLPAGAASAATLSQPLSDQATCAAPSQSLAVQVTPTAAAPSSSMNELPLPSTVPGTPAQPPLSSPSPGKRRIPRIAIVLGCLVLLVGIAGGIAATLFHNQPVHFVHLKSFYSGTITMPGFAPDNITLTVNSQDQQGNVSGTGSIDHVNGDGSTETFSFTGRVRDNHITLQCNYTSSSVTSFDGAVYSDGHIEGVEKASGGGVFDWNVK